MCKTTVFKLLLGVTVLVGTIGPAGRVNAQYFNGNGVDNPSVEVGGLTPDVPMGWYKNSWGTNEATFSYKTGSGYDGTRSLKVDMISYSDGDAKWYFEPISVQAGTKYLYSDHYRSNVITEVVAQITKADSTQSYMYLGAVDPVSAWTEVKLPFTTPVGSDRVTIFHLIDTVGTLETDGFSLAPVVEDVPVLTDGVPNASLEQVSGMDSTKPVGWTSNAWGNNTATFSYLLTGHSGTRSVKTEITRYGSGDAKWYYEPQQIVPGTWYQVGDYYRSNRNTEVVLAIGKTDGSTTYQSLKTAPLSNAWSEYAAAFKAPAGAKSVSMYHVVTGVGFLVTDDYRLVAVPEPVATVTDNVPNNSMEQQSLENPGLPLAWTSGKWGVNTAVFSYAKEGHTGSRSAKVQITRYTTGDAKWSYTPQAVIPGQYYEVSDYYKSNVETQPMVQIGMGDGTVRYYTMRPAPASASVWARYSDYFTAPTGAATMTIFHVLARVGYLFTDDYSVIAKQPGQLTRPLISFTFDDGWESTYANALPLLGKYGVSSTQYIISGLMDTPEYMTRGQISQFISAGHEIGSHTVNHSDLTALSTTKLNAQLVKSKQLLGSAFSVPVTSIASPYGAYNAKVLGAIKPLYASHRTVDEGFNVKDSMDPYAIKVQNVLVGTTAEEVRGWINQAVHDKSWLVLVYHQVDAGGGEYSVTPENLEAHLRMVQPSGITPLTISQALAEIYPQL